MMTYEHMNEEKLAHAIGEELERQISMYNFEADIETSCPWCMPWIWCNQWKNVNESNYKDYVKTVKSELDELLS